MRFTSLLLACALPAIGLAAETVTIQVDATKDIGAISPLVYGINHNDFAKRPEIPFTRQGGNRMTAYNWENNASNAGADWQHQNDAYLGGGDKPGEVARGFAEQALSRGKSVLITVQMAGHVAADKAGDGDVNKTPDYLDKRFVKSYPKKNAPFAYPPDLTDNAVYIDEFAWWLANQFPDAKGRLFFSLDNEPDIWSGTHARIRPQKLTYKEMVDLTTAYASAIKDAVPEALIFGFASYGYAGYMHLQDAPDAGGRDFIEFFLAEMKQAEQKAGRRLLDVMDLHWYPEARGGGQRICFGGTGTAETIRARVQAPRSLWDESYTEDSWISKDVIHGPVNLLPRIQDKIEKNYPGTKLAIMEYDYGGGEHISGAVAQADALGIFGEKGVFAAALWGGGPFNYAAFDSFLNYDGAGGHFGHTAIASSSSNVQDVSVHASRASGDASRLVLVLVNRAEEDRNCTLSLNGFEAATAQLYRIAGSEAKVKPAGQADVKQMITLPAMSVTTMVLQK